MNHTHICREELGERIYLDEGDLVIGTGCGFDDVLIALVEHANEFIPEHSWTAKEIINELKACI